MSKTQWWVYIVCTSNGNLYTGISTDPKRRVYDHNYTSKGSKCLRGQRPVKLVWLCKAETKSKALQEEIRIKNLSRLEKVEVALRGYARIGQQTPPGELVISLEEFEELLWPQ